MSLAGLMAHGVRCVNDVEDPPVGPASCPGTAACRFRPSVIPKYQELAHV